MRARDDRGHELASLWVRRADGRRMHGVLGTAPLPVDRPLVVLVHGLIVSSRYMQPLARALAPHVRVLAPDLPGFGRSRGGPTLGFDDLADALVDWLDALEVDRAAFVGNSMGCQLITNLAARHPARVSCAVLQGPTGEPRPLWRLIGGLLLDGLQKGATRLPWIMLRDLWDAGLLRAVRTLQAMRADRTDPRLAAVECPTLVVRGTRDLYASRGWAEHVARLLPRGRFVEVPGADHTINFTHPERLARLVVPFVLGAPTPRPTHEPLLVGAGRPAA